MQIKDIHKLVNGNYIAIIEAETSGPGRFAHWTYLRLVEFNNSSVYKMVRSPCVIKVHDEEMVDARCKGPRSYYTSVLTHMRESMWGMAIDMNSVAIIVKDTKRIENDCLVPLRFPNRSHGLMFGTLENLKNFQCSGLGDEFEAKFSKEPLYFGNTGRCVEIAWE